ncbi:hypothetical protein AC1031_012000 [Aphanomyces cochlioides]|nr:hypothetical protein AC1031_012000 [Aphanomyces cochlioides]
MSLFRQASNNEIKCPSDPSFNRTVGSTLWRPVESLCMASEPLCGRLDAVWTLSKRQYSRVSSFVLKSAQDHPP